MIKEFSKDKIISKIKVFLCIVILQCIATSAWLLLLPGEEQNARFLGYSFRRLALLIPLIGPIILGLLLKNRISRWIFSGLSGKRKKAIAIVVIFNGLFIALLWSVIFLYHFLRIFGDVGFYTRLLPLITNYFLIGLEIHLFIIQLFLKSPANNIKKRKFPWTAFAAALLITILLALLIIFTGWGYAENRLVIVSLGIPLLEGQIWYITGLLLIILITAIAWQAIVHKNAKVRRIKWDAVIFLLLWAAAVVLWTSQPLPDHNYFAPSERERPPNFEKYPFSDAEQYDYNSLYVLYGTTENLVISKPFYVSFLAILHAIAGLDYSRVVFLQTLVLALFPGVLFLIGRELHSRLGGIAIALFAIFRELNSIQASTMANVSNSKLLLSEGLAALLMSLLAFVLIRWFKSKDKKMSHHAFLAGGITGALILTRLQTMVLIPFLLALVVFRYWRLFKPILSGIALFFLGCALILTPVLIRNHKITGVYWVDNPSSSAGLYRYYTMDTDLELDIPEAETQAEELRRNISVMTNALITGFGDISSLIMDNFMRNEASSFLTLPIRLGNQPALMDLLMIREPFWAEFYSQPSVLNVLIFIINAVLLSLGFSSAYKNRPKPTIAFLALHIIYNLSSAVVRLSGWRFIQSADWILYTFFALGLVEAIHLLAERFTFWPHSAAFMQWLEDPELKPPARPITRNIILFGCVFLLVGGFIHLREALLPKNVPTYSRSEICSAVNDALQNSSYANEYSEFEAYCLSEDTPVLAGYGMYPRYFKSGEGYYDRPEDPYFGKQEYNRLVFRMVGEQITKVFFRTSNPDIEFPNGTTVFVVGRNNFEFNYQFLLVPGHDDAFLISDPLRKGLDSIR